MFNTSVHERTSWSTWSPRRHRRRVRRGSGGFSTDAFVESTSSAFEIRKLDARDSHHILRLFESLTPRDRYFRFHTPMPRLNEATFRRLLAMDDSDHVAFGAFRGGVCIGIGRYVRLNQGHSDAEVAVAVEPASRNQGVGTRLLHELAMSARENGIIRFTGLIHPQNAAALNGARALGFQTTFIDGQYIVFVELDRLIARSQRELRVG